MRITALGVLAFLAIPRVLAQEPLRLAIAGLVHGHAAGFFRAAQTRRDVTIIGVYEPDAALAKQYASRYGLPPEVFYTDLDRMLDAVKPEAVAAFTATYDHPRIVEAAAARKLAVMMEKPLAVSMEHAREIERTAGRSGIPVVVNYETTWYPNHAALKELLIDKRATGEIRKMAATDGHQGPKEIGVGPEFFAWLTDPVKNGAGALFDFGCYGANLMTWLMDNQRPLSVTAVTRQVKPAVYPHVEDEATVVLQYPRAQGIIQASWNWPFNRKDFEVYTERAYAVAGTGGASLRVRLPDAPEEVRTPQPLPADEKDPVSYLRAVARGKIKPSGLSSLENNLVVTEILTAARESARTGQTVRLRQ